MKITQVKLGRISTPLRVPFKTALRTVSSVEDVIVELHTDTGAVGYGEAPPTGVITGDTTGAIIGAIRDHIAPAILGRNLDEFEDLTAAVQKALVHNTSAKAAVDMALWDLLGQKYSAPVYRMLGGARSNIVTDITISVNPPEEMARDARTAIQRGYDCLKVKVGIDPELDVARLAAVREAVGKDVKLRIDANQAWNAKQAVRILDQMQEKGLDIEFVEQPVPAADLEGMQYVTRHAGVPVLADESVFSPADALRIMQTWPPSARPWARTSSSASTPIRRGMQSRLSASSTRCRRRAWTSSSSSSLCLRLTSRGCSTSPATPACRCWPMRACSARRTPCASCRPAQPTL